MSSQKPPCSWRLGNTYECLLLDFNFCTHAANQKVHMHRRRRFTTHRDGRDLTQHTLQEICESRSKSLRSCHKWLVDRASLLIHCVWGGLACYFTVSTAFPWHDVQLKKLGTPVRVRFSPPPQVWFPSCPSWSPTSPWKFPKLTVTCQLHRHCITWTQPLPVLPRIATLANHNQMKLRELSHRCSLQLVVLSWCPGRSQSATTRRRPWFRVKPEAWTGIGCRAGPATTVRLSQWISYLRIENANEILFCSCSWMIAVWFVKSHNF